MNYSKACYCVEERKICNSEQLKERVQQLVLYGSHLGLVESRNVYRPFLNLELLDALFCMYDVTVLFAKYGIENLNRYVKDMLHRIHFMGKADSDDLFAIKSDDQDLSHEFAITAKYTNRLRKMIPNFHYSFAGLKLNLPKSRREEKEEIKQCVVLCPCDTSQNVDYLLSEQLNGISLADALKQDAITVQDFLSWTVQIILALEMSHLHFDFGHNNLTPENIMLRKLGDDWIWKQKGKKSYLAYFHRNEIYYVKSKSTVVVVDFNLARTKDEGGVRDHEHEGIFPNESRPFYDLYKLIMSSLRILQTRNRNLFFEVRKIAKFFGVKYEKELDMLLTNEEKLGYIYSLEITNLERSRSISDFLDFIQDTFPEMKHILISGEEFFEQPLIVNSETLKDEIKIAKKLDYFPELRDIIQRLDGLSQRKDKLFLLNGEVCQIGQENLCNFNTVELKMAEEELLGFEILLEENKLEIQAREMKRIEKYIKETNSLIVLNNFQLKKYKETYFNPETVNPYKNNLILNCLADEECKKLLNHYNLEEQKFKLKFITQDIWEKANVVRGRLDIEFRRGIILEDLKLIVTFENRFNLNSLSSTEFKLEALEDLCF